MISSKLVLVIFIGLSVVDTSNAFQPIHHYGNFQSTQTLSIIGQGRHSHVAQQRSSSLNTFWQKAAETVERNSDSVRKVFWQRAVDTTEKTTGKAARNKAVGKLSGKAAKTAKAGKVAKAGKAVKAGKVAKAGKAAAGAKAGKAAAVAAVAAATSVTLPSWQVVSAVCILPTCLGYWKREYGVSYAYGTATALTSGLVFRAVGGGLSFNANSVGGGVGGLAAAVTTTGGLAALHAGAILFYGIRLNLFLLYREMFVKRTKAATDAIEARATKGETNRFAARTPFILSCAYLYYGLCAPLFITAQLGLVKPLAKWVDLVLKVLIGTTWFGFILGALGDFQKSVTKAWKGEKHLVTGGIYRFFRHPNYTGEQIAWTANCLAGLVGAVVEEGTVKKLSLVGYVVSSLLGMVGIDFVLANATNGLENKQRETYGKLPEYQEWMKRSWSGWKVESRTKEESHEEPHLEVNDTPEESGSGI